MYAFPKSHINSTKNGTEKNFASQWLSIISPNSMISFKFYVQTPFFSTFITLHLGKGHIQPVNRAFWPRWRLLRPVYLVVWTLHDKNMSNDAILEYQIKICWVSSSNNIGLIVCTIWGGFFFFLIWNYRLFCMCSLKSYKSCIKCTSIFLVNKESCVYHITYNFLWIWSVVVCTIFGQIKFFGKSETANYFARFHK